MSQALWLLLGQLVLSIASAESHYWLSPAGNDPSFGKRRVPRERGPKTDLAGAIPEGIKDSRCTLVDRM